MTVPSPDERIGRRVPEQELRRRALRKSLRETTTTLLGRNDLMGGLFVTVLALLLVPLAGPSVAVTPEGEVSLQDVLAPKSFRVFDEAATERERGKRAAEVPLTFDFDSRVLDKAIRTIQSIFQVGRASLPSIRLHELSRGDDVPTGGSRSSPLPPSLLVLHGRPDLPQAPPEILSLLAEHGFDAAHEESFLRVLRTVLGKRIGTLDEGLDSGTPIVAHDLGSGEEVKVRSAAEIFTPDQARRFLAAELSQEGDLWDRSARALCESFLASMVKENFFHNARAFEQRRRAAEASVPPLHIEVKKGEKLIGRGEKVTRAAHLKLRTLHDESRASWSAMRALGIVLLLTIFAYGLKRYVEYHQKSEKRVTNLYAMVVLTFLSSALAVDASMAISRSVAERFDRPPYNVADAYLFLAPYAVGSLILTLLVDSEIAMVFAVSFSLIAGLISNPGGDYTVALFALISGFGAIYFTGPYLKRTTVLKSGVAIGATAMVASLGVSLQRGTWEDLPALLLAAAGAFSSGMLAAIVVQALLPLFETLFGILTDLKLSELMSANHPLISELALRAPGTYNHSIIVGTLAESAAKAIGVNPVFMRAAAYYHDIGKMKMPEYFIENQQGVANRHDKLAPSLSALIVRSHVKDGIEMAHAHGLPEELIEMIPAHHGTRLLAYFFRKAKALEDSSLSPVNDADYRYPGPRPRSKEGAIMMLCDAVEAAARSLTDPTSQKFRNVIEKMTETIYLDGQLDETDITLKDLQAIREAFHKVLLSIYHHRIRYPGFDFEKRPERKTSRTPRPAELEETRYE